MESTKEMAPSAKKHKNPSALARDAKRMRKHKTMTREALIETWLESLQFRDDGGDDPLIWRNLGEWYLTNKAAQKAARMDTTRNVEDFTNHQWTTQFGVQFLKHVKERLDENPDSSATKEACGNIVEALSGFLYILGCAQIQDKMGSVTDITTERTFFIRSKIPSKGINSKDLMDLHGLMQATILAEEDSTKEYAPVSTTCSSFKPKPYDKTPRPPGAILIESMKYYIVKEKRLGEAATNTSLRCPGTGKIVSTAEQ
jgi:hypothetical protein